MVKGITDSNRMGIELTNGQSQGIKKLNMWWKLASSPQVFRCFGYAGTGKSTMIYAAMEDMKINIKEDVAFVTFTGKAALVLQRKGIPAMTIHKLIYEAREEQVKVPDGKGGERWKTVTRFVRKTSLPAHIKLIVADECSMISRQIWEDLLFFGLPIMVLGDPGQLPPIEGKSPLFDEEPDVMLTEIRRTAQDDPIVYLSMLFREGKRVRYQKYGPRVAVIPFDRVTDTMLLNHDVILTPKNDTRDELNNYIRYELKGRTKETPEKGDKIICRRNNWDISRDSIPLINGLMGYVENPIELNNPKTFNMDFRPDFMTDNLFQNLETNINMFTCDGAKARKEIINNKYEQGEKFEFAEAISVHLSQGSSWPKVLGYYEPFGDRELRKQLPYTLVTRSEGWLIFAM